MRDRFLHSLASENKDTQQMLHIADLPAFFNCITDQLIDALNS